MLQRIARAMSRFEGKPEGENAEKIDGVRVSNVSDFIMLQGFKSLR